MHISIHIFKCEKANKTINDLYGMLKSAVRENNISDEDLVFQVSRH